MEKGNNIMECFLIIPILHAIMFVALKVLGVTCGCSGLHKTPGLLEQWHRLIKSDYKFPCGQL